MDIKTAEMHEPARWKPNLNSRNHMQALHQFRNHLGWGVGGRSVSACAIEFQERACNTWQVHKSLSFLLAACNKSYSLHCAEYVPKTGPYTPVPATIQPKQPPLWSHRLSRGLDYEIVPPEAFQFDFPLPSAPKLLHRHSLQPHHTRPHTQYLLHKVWGFQTRKWKRAELEYQQGNSVLFLRSSLHIQERGYATTPIPD